MSCGCYSAVSPDPAYVLLPTLLVIRCTAALAFQHAFKRFSSSPSGGVEAPSSSQELICAYGFPRADCAKFEPESCMSIPARLSKDAVSDMFMQVSREDIRISVHDPRAIRLGQAASSPQDADLIHVPRIGGCMTVDCRLIGAEFDPTTGKIWLVTMEISPPTVRIRQEFYLCALVGTNTGIQLAEIDQTMWHLYVLFFLQVVRVLR